MSSPATAVPTQVRSVVVTGVAHAGQLGEAIAMAFAQDGARVSIVSRNARDGAARAAEMRAQGLDVMSFACDLSDSAATIALAKDVLAATGRVDALVNAAGGFAFSGAVADADPSLLTSQFAMNVGTAYAATKAFLPALRRSGGSVVFISSVAALPGGRVKDVSAYAIAKTGVVTLARAVAQEERANGVRSNVVAPGAIRTQSNLASMPATTRYVEPEEVAGTIVFLCSPAAAQITGQVIELSA